MRKLVLFGMFLALAAAAPGALACGPRGGGGGDAVEIEVVIAPSPAATAQSKALLADASKLDGKADTEESASVTVLASARVQRRKAMLLRAQASQVSEASQIALLAKADKLDADAATNDAASASFLARAKVIRARARALRTLSSKVLASGALTTQVLPRVTLPAAPSGHPDSSPLKALDAAPKVAATPIRVVTVGI